MSAEVSGNELKGFSTTQVMERPLRLLLKRMTISDSESEFGYVENGYEVLFVADETIMQINC